MADLKKMIKISVPILEGMELETIVEYDEESTLSEEFIKRETIKILNKSASEIRWKLRFWAIIRKIKSIIHVEYKPFTIFAPGIVKYTPEYDDAKAIKSDWRIIGDDLRKVMGLKYE
jgi:hypothetical protein